MNNTARTSGYDDLNPFTKLFWWTVLLIGMGIAWIIDKMSPTPIENLFSSAEHDLHDIYHRHMDDDELREKIVGIRKKMNDVFMHYPYMLTKKQTKRRQKILNECDYYLAF